MLKRYVLTYSSWLSGAYLYRCSNTILIYSKNRLQYVNYILEQRHFSLPASHTIWLSGWLRMQFTFCKIFIHSQINSNEKLMQTLVYFGHLITLLIALFCKSFICIWRVGANKFCKSKKLEITTGTNWIVFMYEFQKV